MDKRRSPAGPLRAPLGHWIIALILAAAVAFGVHAWLSYKAAQSAQAALLSWNADAVRQIDPDLFNAAEPAVAMAQSILSDSVVAGLAKTASLPGSAAAARIGEFRSRLDLRESPGHKLQVNFRGADPAGAVQTANAVAGILAAGSPAPVPAPAHVTSSPVKARSAPPANPIPAPTAKGNDSLAHSLDQLAAELSATQNKLDNLSSATWERREHAGQSSSYREAEEQQLLTNETGAALKELADLRSDPDSAQAQEPLRRIQEALLSVWPASRAYRGSRSLADHTGFNAAGVNAGRLRLERAEFAHAVDVARKEQVTVQRLQPPVQSAAPAAPAPSASETPATDAASSSAPSESDLPAAGSAAAEPSGNGPFRLLRPAGTPMRSPLWPSVLAGFCCGVVYLTVAGSRYGQDEEDEEYPDETPMASQRMITPAKPTRAAEFFASADPRPPGPPPDRPSDIVLPPPHIEPPDPPERLQDEKGSDRRDQELLIDAEEIKRTSGDGVAAEKAEGDPWVDNMMKALSETSIGKMFERSPAQDRTEKTEPQVDGRRFSIRPDRLAG